MQNKKNINEMFEIDTKGKIKTRLPYVKINNWIKSMNVAEIKKKYFDAQNLFEKLGITFSTYENSDEERLLPFDIIPRIINYKEWQLIEKGIKQRSKALNAFLNDIYNKGAIIKAGIIPENLIYQNPAFEKEMVGINVPGKIYSHIIGTDLVRIEKNKFYALEDNCRTPSGVSYMLENRMVMRDVFPELFTRYKVASIHQYTNKLFNCMNECIPKKTAHPHMVVLTPGIYNSAYFEHSFLAEQMGIALVEGKDLFVENDMVFMKTVKGPLKVDCIYRRLDDNFLDPKAFNKDSVIGVPGLFKCWLKKNVGIINAVGTGVADDKVVYSYVNRMIVYYLGEQPILNQVETYLCHDESQKKYVLENLSKLVVKPANASGGYGIMIGPKASSKEREEVAEKIKKNPREYIAQPLETLSTAPTITEKNIEPRHLDLRPFVLSGKTSYVTTGGLTRVALRKGSTIVNSSQGGGSKDTLVIEK